MQLSRGNAYLAGIATATIVAVMSACGSQSHQSGPEPAPGSFVNAPNIKGFKAPGGYRNILVFCDGPNMVYETSRGDIGSTAEGTSSSLYVIPNDPRCTGKPQ